MTECVIYCISEEDLCCKNILKTLSAMKGKLMLEIAPVTYTNIIECDMTPIVKQNIITASKKLKMFGKKRPIIARFDEYGNRLPDEITIGEEGIKLNIIDPTKVGSYYIKLSILTVDVDNFSVLNTTYSSHK